MCIWKSQRYYHGSPHNTTPVQIWFMTGITYMSEFACFPIAIDFVNLLSGKCERCRQRALWLEYIGYIRQAVLLSNSLICFLFTSQIQKSCLPVLWRVEWEWRWWYWSHFLPFWVRKCTFRVNAKSIKPWPCSKMSPACIDALTSPGVVKHKKNQRTLENEQP